VTTTLVPKVSTYYLYSTWKSTQQRVLRHNVRYSRTCTLFAVLRIPCRSNRLSPAPLLARFSSMVIRKKTTIKQYRHFRSGIANCSSKKTINQCSLTSPESLVFLPVLNGPKPVQYHHHHETLHRFGRIGITIHLWSSPVQIEKQEKCGG
jgi:hypothetical protein